MYKCFSKFYSNDYKIIIIEDNNGGGFTELCLPFTRYVNPKIANPFTFTMKSTNLMLKTFFKNDENLNPETCFPYTEKDNAAIFNIFPNSNSVQHKFRNVF